MSAVRGKGRPSAQMTRDSLRDDAVRRMMLATADGSYQPLSQEELDRRRQALLELMPPGDLWVFAYGSLIWNPTFHHAEARPARLFGFHRRFCLWAPVGRGTPECPGLWLGLVPGGSCRGMVFRIAADQREEETDLLWRREMLGGGYVARRQTLATPGGPVEGVAFVANRANPRYVPDLPLERVAQAVAAAEGPLGPCRDYLFNTVQHLEEMGFQDRGLRRVAQAVHRHLAPD